MSVISNLEPKLLWKHFDEIRKIPHGSGNETALGQYVIDFAKSHGLEWKKDDVGNVLVTKKGSAGHESAAPVVLQGHLDMVCEKNSDKEFDFDKDAIELVIDGDWLTADGTTLGADNGVGVAAALAILEDDSLVHPPIEAIFTIDEERGLVGAMSISSDWLQGRTMINMDSEELGVFSIGCAGGRDELITLPVKKTNAKNDLAVEIKLAGLRGGHSGIDIHEGRGNALKIMNRLIYQLGKTVPVELACFKGGDKHNAIPREAFAEIVIPAAQSDAANEWLQNAIQDIQVEFKPVEKNINLQFTPQETVPQVFEADTQKALMALIFALPHGPLAMSRSIKDLVETSNNVAAIKCHDDSILVHCSSRSSNMRALEATTDKISAIAEMAGASIELPPGYPGWMPDLDSKILKISLDTYKKITGKDAEYMAIHAGLECGLIGEKFPGMDMISIGPDLNHPHSPDECVHIGTVDIFYKHVLEMLKNLV